MKPETIALVGVFAGWMLFAASIVPILMRPRAGSAKRSPASLGAMALQGVGFAIVWGWNRPVVIAMGR
jgi:hypothetical protein